MWKWKKEEDTDLVSAKCVDCGAIYYPNSNEWDAVNMESHSH